MPEWVQWVVIAWGMALMLIMSIVALVVVLLVWQEMRPPRQKLADKLEADAVARLNKQPSSGRDQRPT